jgi:hypothetical protein
VVLDPFVSIDDLQELQRVVDAIILAPHVTNVNGRDNIPLGNSYTRRAMYDTFKMLLAAHKILQIDITC